MIEGTVASGVDWDTLWLAIGLLVLAVALLLGTRLSLRKRSC